MTSKLTFCRSWGLAPAKKKGLFMRKWKGSSSPASPNVVDSAREVTEGGAEREREREREREKLRERERERGAERERRWS